MPQLTISIPIWPEYPSSDGPGVLCHVTKLKSSQIGFLNMIMSLLYSHGLHSHQISVQQSIFGDVTGDSMSNLQKLQDGILSIAPRQLWKQTRVVQYYRGLPTKVTGEHLNLNETLPELRLVFGVFFWTCCWYVMKTCIFMLCTKQDFEIFEAVVGLLVYFEIKLHKHS